MKSNILVNFSIDFGLKPKFFGFLKPIIFYQEENIDTGSVQTFISGLGQKKLDFIKMSSAILSSIKIH